MMHRAPKSYRVMTYNVHRCVGLDRRHDPARIAEVIARADPDVVALQELEVGHPRTEGLHQPRRLADLLGMDVHYHPARQAGGAGFGNAILSRLPVHGVRSATLPRHRFLPLQRRGALSASILFGNQEVRIFNTHLGLVHGERVLQAGALCGSGWLDHPECRERPRIVCGDFNATPRSSVYRLFDGGLRDAQTVSGGRARRTWPSFLPVTRYDHVFVCPKIAVMKVDVPRTPLTRVASDHLPLVVDVQLHAEPGGV